MCACRVRVCVCTANSRRSINSIICSELYAGDLSFSISNTRKRLNLFNLNFSSCYADAVARAADVDTSELSAQLYSTGKLFRKILVQRNPIWKCGNKLKL